MKNNFATSAQWLCIVQGDFVRHTLRMVLALELRHSSSILVEAVKQHLVSTY